MAACIVGVIYQQVMVEGASIGVDGYSGRDGLITATPADEVVDSAYVAKNVCDSLSAFGSR